MRRAKLHGKAIDPQAAYTLVCHSYYLVEGGGSYSMLCKNPVTLLGLDNDALMEYVQLNLRGVIGQQYAGAAGQGRIATQEAPEPDTDPDPQPHPKPNQNHTTPPPPQHRRLEGDFRSRCRRGGSRSSRFRHHSRGNRRRTRIATSSSKCLRAEGRSPFGPLSFSRFCAPSPIAALVMP